MQKNCELFSKVGTTGSINTHSILLEFRLVFVNENIVENFEYFRENCVNEKIYLKCAKIVSQQVSIRH